MRGGDRVTPVAPFRCAACVLENRRAFWMHLAIVVTSLAALGLLAGATAWPAVAAWDAGALRSLAGWRTPAGDQAFRLLTSLGSPWFLLVLATLAGLAGWPSRAERDRLLPLLALGAATLGNALLKAWFQRPRPGLEFHPLAQEPYSSLPSGHAMLSLCVYGILAGLMLASREPRNRRWLPVTLLALVILAVGFGRMYLAVHYPSDVLAGYAAGLPIVWGVLACRQVQPSRRRKTSV